MERPGWKQKFMKRVPRKHIVTDIREEIPGTFSLATELDGLDESAYSAVSLLLLLARHEQDENAFLGLLDALTEHSAEKVTTDQLYMETDAKILLLLGMEVPEHPADSFTFTTDPTTMR